MPLVTMLATMLLKEEGNASSPLGHPKEKGVGSRLSHLDVSSRCSMHDTSSSAGAIPKSSDFHVAPSNPHSVAEPQLPSLEDHVAYQKSCFGSIAIPK